MTYEQEVWLDAIRRAEEGVMRVCPHLVGGRLDGETVEHFASRGVAALNTQLARLKAAQDNYAKVAPK